MADRRDDVHFEPFLHLAGLDDDQALIAWGGFWFRPARDGRGVRIVDDEELEEVEPGRTESMGARAMSYGPAVVEAWGPDGELAARVEVEDRNHAWLRGLRADTTYRYRVTVRGTPWAEHDLMRWHRLDPQHGELRPAGRGYDLRFRTLPDRESDAGLVFCAIGDYGVGIQSEDETGLEQLRLAAALERAIDHHDVRLIVTLGDNIYHAEGNLGGSGHEDDDWYFSFYEPYRWLLSQVPIYPAVGNHDSGETEVSDDRAQLVDNHYLDLRFDPEVEEGRASVDPGLFYRLDYSQRVQFICIDTSEADELEERRFFAHPQHLHFIDDALSAGGERRCWRIPFCHHPPFCAGPAHGNDPDMIEILVPRFERRGVRLVLSGHEHNFQYSVKNGVHYLVSGAGGKLRAELPDRFAAAHTRAWAIERHFLMMQIDGDEGTIWPLRDVGERGELRCIEAHTPDGSPFPLPIRIRR